MHGATPPMHEVEAGGKLPSLAAEPVIPVGHSTAPGNSIIRSLISHKIALGESLPVLPHHVSARCSDPTTVAFELRCSPQSASEPPVEQLVPPLEEPQSCIPVASEPLPYLVSEPGKVSPASAEALIPRPLTGSHHDALAPPSQGTPAAHDQFVPPLEVPQSCSPVAFEPLSYLASETGKVFPALAKVPIPRRVATSHLDAVVQPSQGTLAAHELQRSSEPPAARPSLLASSDKTMPSVEPSVCTLVRSPATSPNVVSTAPINRSLDPRDHQSNQRELDRLIHTAVLAYESSADWK
jgi:hypothetical protein